MDTIIEEFPAPSSTQQPVPFGVRLKLAREALGLERKDVAAQLHLNERVIIMMEKGRYPADLHATFIRGYLRSYGQLMQIPEFEIKKAIEPIKPKPVSTQTINPTQISLAPPVVTSSNYFMQLFSYLLVFTLIGLAGTWWYTRLPISSTGPLAENQATKTNNIAMTQFASNLKSMMSEAPNLAMTYASNQVNHLLIPPAAAPKPTPVAEEDNGSDDHQADEIE